VPGFERVALHYYFFYDACGMFAAHLGGLCRAGGGEVEQIRLLLGRGSIQTTEQYIGTKQDLVNAPNDGIMLRVTA
jgi:hypothetical protein